MPLPRYALSLLILLALSRPALAFPDPLESFNRGVYWLNGQMRGLGGAGDGSPVRDNYERAVPAAMRTGIANIFANLREPVTALSSLLAGDLDNAGVAARRFVLNSTLGFGGVHDVARGRYGLESRLMELGQVVCAHGLPEGPYLVLPLFGPTTLPEMAGRVLTIVGGYQLFGRPYFRYRLGDRLARVAEGQAGYTTPVPLSPAPPHSSPPHSSPPHSSPPLSAPAGSQASEPDTYQAEKNAYEAYRQKSCATARSRTRTGAVIADIYAPSAPQTPIQ